MGTEALGPERRRERRSCPGSAREALRAAVDAPPSRDGAAEAHAAATIARLPRATVAAWDEALRAALVDDAYRRAATLTRAWLRPSVGEGLTEDERERRLERALQAAEGCCARADGGRGRQVVLDEEGTARRYVHDELCGTRACLPCARRRLRRAIDRWSVVVRAPLRPGYVAAFITIGSVGAVRDRTDVRRYLGRLGRLWRGVTEGIPRYGLPPRTWVGGLRALELCPRAEGGWAHCHLYAIRRDYYPYGLSEAALFGRYLTGQERNAFACLSPGSLGHEREHARLTRAIVRDRADPEDLGLRALLRRLGIGEVFRDDVVSTADDADPIGSYLAKIERYVGKIEKDDGSIADASWEGRVDLQRTMRGARLIEPWGAVRGLLGGPDEVWRETTADRVRRGALSRVGVYDPADRSTWRYLPDGIADEAGPELTSVRRTWYREDTLETWRPWCDVDRLRAGVGL